MMRIMVRPDVCAGEPCVSGTNVRVAKVLALVRSGCPPQVIAQKHFPELTPTDVRACVRFAHRWGIRYHLPGVAGNAGRVPFRPLTFSRAVRFGFPLFQALVGGALLLVYLYGLKTHASAQDATLAAAGINPEAAEFAARRDADAEILRRRGLAGVTGNDNLSSQVENSPAEARPRHRTRRRRRHRRYHRGY